MADTPEQQPEQQQEQQQDQLQLKQSLLQTEIIEKNYDQMEFLNFCTSQKENGDDLNNWSYEELKTCVANFQENVLKKESDTKKSSLNFFLSNAKQNVPPSQPQIPQQNMQNISNTSIPNQNQNIYNNQPYQNYSPYQQQNQSYNPNIPQNYQQYSTYQQYNPQTQGQYQIPNNSMQGIPSQTPVAEIICKKSEKTILNDKEIKVLIQNPKTSEKSLLSSQYTIYEVCTESMHWLVHRRYSDFDWLRNILSKFFPRILIPPIPGKKVGNRRFEQDFIEKRMKFLQIFIDKVMQNETLKSSEALYAFLSFGDRVQFDRKQKELNSIVPSQYCEDLKTLSGKLTVLYDDFNENYYVNLNNYFKLQYQVYTRLNFNMRSFYKNMTVACMNLEEVHKDFETLNILNSKVMMKDSIIKTYEELSIFFKNWKLYYLTKMK